MKLNETHIEILEWTFAKMVRTGRGVTELDAVRRFDTDILLSRDYLGIGHEMKRLVRAGLMEESDGYYSMVPEFDWPTNTYTWPAGRILKLEE